MERIKFIASQATSIYKYKSIRYTNAKPITGKRCIIAQKRPDDGHQ
jgi:hypothetical protein